MADLKVVSARRGLLGSWQGNWPAHNIANLMRTPALPEAVAQSPLTRLREKLIKTSAKVVRHACSALFQM